MFRASGPLTALPLAAVLLSSCIQFNNPEAGRSVPSSTDETPSQESAEEEVVASDSPLQLPGLDDLSIADTTPITLPIIPSGGESFNGTSCSELVLLAVATDPDLFDEGSFTLTGTYPQCSLQITPAAGQCGSTYVTLTLSLPNGASSDDVTFQYTATGTPYTLSVENAPDGIGTAIDGTALSEASNGDSFALYSVVRNQCGDFISNQSVIWELPGTDESVASIDPPIASSSTLGISMQFIGPRAPATFTIQASHADYSTVSAEVTYAYSNGGLQLWLDAQADGTLFQDIAGTIPATEPNDEIQLWKDRSGKNRDAVQWASARNPQLSTTGSHPTLRFTRDCLQLGASGEDFDILDTDEFTIAFHVARDNQNNALANDPDDTNIYNLGRYMPLLSLADPTTGPALGLLRIVANNSYALASQYRTDRTSSFWLSANSFNDNGGQCFGNTGSGSCPAGSASEAPQIAVIRANTSGIQQQFLRTGTMTIAELKATFSNPGAAITAMLNTAPSASPAFLGCDYDHSEAKELEGAVVNEPNKSLHRPFTGSFGEVIIYNRYLNNEETVNLINQLSTKWEL